MSSRMSLNSPRSRRLSRGASVVEYALLLFMLVGGAAAAVKGTGVSVRNVFAGSVSATGASDSAELGQAGLGSAPDRRDGGN
jgi:hypothetical protein